MASVRYTTLAKQVQELRKHLLPRTFSATGTYTDAARLKAASFRIHCHAEIEYYLEELLRDLITAAKAHYQNTNPGTPALSLLTQAETLIKPNNGIKEQHVQKLFGQVGLDLQSLPGPLLPALTSYGMRRGTYAHSSRAVYTASILIDPQTEWTTIQQILSDLQAFDTAVLALIPLF
jgi:hypothetical protein